MKLRFLTAAMIIFSITPALAKSQDIILPNGQNCALSSTIDKSMRSLCHTLAQRQAEQKHAAAASAASQAADITPAAGDNSKKKNPPQKKSKPVQ